MKKFMLGFAIITAIALLSMEALQVKAQDAGFTGAWEMTVTGGGPGGGGGHRGGGGGGTQSLTIAQDGEKFKVTHKTTRGDSTSEATVSGNTISWTEEHQGHDGETRKIEYKATLDGDTMKGTMSGGQFSRDFTAKRSK